jgi:methionyl-tRNA formyltransferase
MKIVFLGSAQFGEPSLRALVESGHEVACVVTQQDKPKNRGLHLEPTPIKVTAQKLGLPVYQPVNINSADSIEFLQQYRADLFIVIAYGQILSSEVLKIARIMPLNVHASILPAYRGAAPINWCIANGETKTGNTLIRMNEKMDAGPILMHSQIPIDRNDTAETLERVLAFDAAALLLQGVMAISAGTVVEIPQDVSKVSIAPKLKKQHGQIQWNMSARSIIDTSRGMCPWPGTFTHLSGKLLKVFGISAEKCNTPSGTAKAGTVTHIGKNELYVQSADELIRISEVQMEGKRRMSVSEFLLGHKLTVGDVLE